MARPEQGKVSELQWLCRSILQEDFPEFRDMEVAARFYPYIGLTHTIRRKGAAWVVRISDHCAHAARPVLEAIVRILVGKMKHRRPHQKYLQTYEAFRNDPWIKEAVRERRLRKGRKHITEETGRHHSLQELYQELNSCFFNNQIELCRIGWGLRRSRLRLGHYDPVHHTITLSPLLDQSEVPRFVVRYIVYHEMLHAVFESTPAGRFTRHHTSEFRRAERAYPDFEPAKKFLREFSSRLRQKDRRRHGSKYGIKPDSR